MTKLSTKQWLVLCVLAWMATFALVADSQAHDAHKPGDPWTAEYMWRRYRNTTSNCPGDSNAPEYDCTGIILRGTTGKNVTKAGPQGSWIPEDKSYGELSGDTSLGGVSFSYIRTDSKFTHLADNYANGFTLLPFSGKYTYPKDGTWMSMTVLCAYPFDAGTGHRGWGGCSVPIPKTLASSNPWQSCQTAGINNAADWEYHFRNDHQKFNPQINYLYYGQCGFDMRDGHRRPGDFTAVLEARRNLQNKSNWLGTEYNNSLDNELRIATWGMSRAENATVPKPYVPIESFFYIAGSANGRAYAQTDQKVWFEKTRPAPDKPGIFIPVIRITPPSGPKGDYDFNYSKSDQVVPVPTFPAEDPLPCGVGNFDTLCPK
jgi:hypothetical protein